MGRRLVSKCYIQTAELWSLEEGRKDTKGGRGNRNCYSTISPVRALALLVVLPVSSTFVIIYNCVSWNTSKDNTLCPPTVNLFCHPTYLTWCLVVTCHWLIICLVGMHYQWFTLSHTTIVCACDAKMFNWLIVYTAMYAFWM